MEFDNKLSDYYKNISELENIHEKYDLTLGSDNYLVKLSLTLAKSLNEFIKFIDIMQDKDEYLSILLELSYDCLEIYNSMSLDLILEKSRFKKKRLLKKSYIKNKENIDKVLDRMDIISEKIDNAIKTL